jgi:hypothetical protein
MSAADFVGCHAAAALRRRGTMCSASTTSTPTTTSCSSAAAWSGVYVVDGDVADAALLAWLLDAMSSTSSCRPVCTTRSSTPFPMCAPTSPASSRCSSRRSSGPPPPRSTSSTPVCRSPSMTGRTDRSPSTRADISRRWSVVGKCGAAANTVVAATSFVAHSQIWWSEFEERGLTVVLWSVYQGTVKSGTRTDPCGKA